MYLAIVLIWNESCHIVECDINHMLLCLLRIAHSILITVDAIDEAWVNQEGVRQIVEERCHSLFISWTKLLLHQLLLLNCTAI